MGRMRRPVRVEVIVISVCGGVHVGVVLMVVVGGSVVRHGEVSCLTSLNNLDPAWVRLRRLKWRKLGFFCVLEHKVLFEAYQPFSKLN